MRMWSIARGGMKGRKRDTRLLFTVVTLSFMFITVATVLLSSIRHTEQVQQNALYGSWQLMLAEADSAQRDALSSTKGVDTFSASQILAVHDSYGTIATIDDALADMGSLRLLEGRLPQADNEIAFEANQIAKLKTPLKVGDTITLTFQQSFSYTLTEEELLKSEQEQGEADETWREVKAAAIEAMGDNRAAYEARYERWFASTEQSAVYYRQWAAYWAEVENTYDESALNGSSEYERADQLSPGLYEELFFIYLIQVSTDDVFLDVRNAYGYGDRSWDNNIARFENDLLSYEDVSITVTTRQQDMKKHDPNVKPRYATLHMPYTVTGILESYSDRWDSSVYTLPNAFVAQESADKIMRAYEVIREKYVRVPAYEPRYLLFARSDSMSARALFSAFRPTYQTLVSGGGPTYQVNNYHVMVEPNGGYGSVYCSVYGIDEETDEPVYLEAFGRLDGTPGTDFSAVINYKNESYTVGIEDLLAGSFQIKGLLPPSQETVVTLEEADTDNTAPLRINTYAYPPSASAGNTLMYVVSGIIVVTTACAVFQIYLTQLKRRTRRLALLKSIGATNSQLFSMFAFELLYLLLLSLPTGLFIGLGLAYAAVKLLPAQGVLGALLYSIDWHSLGAGLAGGALALVAGAVYPMLRALNTPLTGSVSGQKKTRAVRRVQDTKLRRQSFSSIAARNARANPGRTRGNFALCAFILSIMLACVFLCFNAFKRYNTTVLLSDKPDYRLDAPYGMNIRFLAEFEEILRQTGETERVETYKAAENIYLYFDGLLENSPILSALDQSLPASMRDGFFGVPEADLGLPEAEEIPLSLRTDLLGIFPDSELFERLSAAITEGSIDKERFQKGDEVILLVPMYQNGAQSPENAQFADTALYDALPRAERMRTFLRKTGVMDLSYFKAKSAYYKTDAAVRAGDALTLKAISEKVTDGGVTKSLRTSEVTVGAMIRYFPDTGIWPFVDSSTGYTVISGASLPGVLYDAANWRLDAAGVRQLELLTKAFKLQSRGKTYFYLYASENATRENTDLKLLSLAREYGLTLNNYRETNAALYNEAFNNAFLIGLLGFTAAMIALTILLNTLESTADQERARMGVLQSMGVLKRQFITAQIRAALANGLLSLLVANALLALLLTVFALVENSGIALSFFGLVSAVAGSLWLFPWKVYALVGALYLFILVFLYVRPTRRVLKKSPIENIRG